MSDPLNDHWHDDIITWRHYVMAWTVVASAFFGAVLVGIAIGGFIWGW